MAPFAKESHSCYFSGAVRKRIEEEVESACNLGEA